MDQPALDVRQHAEALRGLSRLNRWTRSARLFWEPISALARRARLTSLRVLDIATGGGDAPIRLARRAARSGLRLTIEGCDRSPTAIDYAHAQAERAGVHIRFFLLDALADEIPPGYDVITTSLFLHHLDHHQTRRFLQRASQAAGRMLVVHDLVRSRPGLWLSYLGTRLLTTSEIVRADGPQSVRAAYTLEELRVLAHDAPLQGCTLSRRWPSRVLLTWTRPSSAS